MTTITIDVDDRTISRLADCHDPDRHDDLASTLQAALEVYDELENPEEMRPDPEAVTPGV